MNKEDFVSHECAELLKEKGFDEPCLSFYSERGGVWTAAREENFNESLTGCSRPSLYDAQKWLREKYKLHITIYSCSQESWQYRITKHHQKLEDGIFEEDFNSYESALNDGIMGALKLI